MINRARRSGVGGMAGLVIGASVVLMPDSAVAATESVVVANDGSHTVTFTAGSGQENDLRLTASSTLSENGYFYIEHFRFDDVTAITPGVGCTRPEAADPTVAVCDLGQGGDYYPRLSVDVGDRNDRVELGAGSENTVHGGPGDDLLIRSHGHLYGDDGDDILIGDYTSGGGGNDLIYGGGDGGPGDDTLIGTARGQSLSGGPGDDVLYGQGGRDYLYGNSGADLLRGGPGDDMLFGGPGQDVLYGNSGKDTLRGGPERDALFGGSGVNRLYQDS